MAIGDKKVLVALTSCSVLGDTGKPTGSWLPEIAHVVNLLEREEYAVEFVSPQGGRAPIDPASLRRPDSGSAAFAKRYVQDGAIANTRSPDEIQPDEYAAIYYPGGHGPMWDIAQDSRIAGIARTIYESDGVVAAVCHGPAGLLPVHLSDGSLLIQDKHVTSVTDLEEWIVGKAKVVPFLLETELRKQAGRFSRSIIPGLSHVVADGKLVTGQNPRSAHGVGNKILELLRG